MPRSAPCGAAVRAALGGSLAVIALAGCGASAGRASSTTRASGSATAVEATLAPTGGPAGGATTDQSAPSGAAASVTTGSTTSTPARTTTTPTSRATSDPVRTPQLRHLQAVLLRWLRAAGPETGALVYDMTDHATLFTVRASRAGLRHRSRSCTRRSRQPACSGPVRPFRPRFSAPAGSNHTASGTEICTCAATAIQRSETGTSTVSTRTATVRPHPSSSPSCAVTELIESPAG